MVGVSASVNLPLHHKVQKFSSGTGSPRWSQKKGCKTFVVVVIHCIASRIIQNASFELDNLGKGNDMVTYDETGAWGKRL